MTSPRESGWVSVAAVAWALDHAPNVPASMVSTLVAVARYADQDGRNAHPSIETIARGTRKSERQVQRDLAHLRQLGLLLPGDPRAVAHLPADRRPAVFDLPLRLRRGDADVTSSAPRGDTHDTSRGDTGDATGCHGRPNGVTPTSPKEDFKKQEEPSSSGRPSRSRPAPVADLDDDETDSFPEETPQPAGHLIPSPVPNPRRAAPDAPQPPGVATGTPGTPTAPSDEHGGPGRRPSCLTRIAAVTGADDDEAGAIVEKIKTAAAARGKPIINLGGYVASMPDEHLVEHLAELRASREKTTGRTDRGAFIAWVQTQPECEHRFPGGHIPDPAGWVTCPIQRNRGPVRVAA